MFIVSKYPQRKADEDTVVIKHLSDVKIRFHFSVDISKVIYLLLISYLTL